MNISKLMFLDISFKTYIVRGLEAKFSNVPYNLHSYVDKADLYTVC